MEPRQFSLWKGARELLYTVVICILIALFLTWLEHGGSLAENLIISNSIGLSIFLIIHILLYALRPGKRSTELVVISSGIILGIFLGWQIASLAIKGILSVSIHAHGNTFYQAMILGTTFGVVVTFFFWSSKRLSATEALMQEERIKRLSSEKEALEARLRLLQAQIEPHFLFNTLSNIRSLMDTDPEGAKSMIMDLNQYLRNTLNRTRRERITLGQEIEVVEAYLGIFKVRMGERLRYLVDIPQAMKQRPFPPMLVQPLVENAVRHGLEPLVSGGEVIIRGEEKDAHLRVEVTDTGSGLAEGHVPGIGLNNVRERLRLLYGEKARLILEENRPSGVRAIIEVPHDGAT
ncbi:MAG: histidine kinase [Deltaproteobacteria bacterium]|nr:histidine kinase [Deltaproteobacteria bacterium]